MERTQQHYYSLNDYLKEEFGEKVYKLSLDGGMTCPNRDGKVGEKGCIFCSQGGSGEFAEPLTISITQQIEAAKENVNRKMYGTKYIAYFQSFTNTYAPTQYLEKIFYEAITHKDILILSIATRPDCLSDEVIELLFRLNKIKPVWVELGLQTIHESTAKYIRRGYDLKCFDIAVAKLKRIGVKVIVHIIIGLPGENMQDILQTIQYISDKFIDGIKLQLLYVLKNTDLAIDYHKGLFSALSLEEYINFLIKCIEHIPPYIVIHRITGDGPKSLLVAPEWSANKKKVLNTINKIFRDKHVIQGKQIKKNNNVVDS